MTSCIKYRVHIAYVTPVFCYQERIIPPFYLTVSDTLFLYTCLVLDLSFPSYLFVQEIFPNPYAVQLGSFLVYSRISQHISVALVILAISHSFSKLNYILQRKKGFYLPYSL